MTDHSHTEFIDWNDAFENGAYIPGSADMPAEWARRSQCLRDTLVAQGCIDFDVAYGDDARQRYDLLRPPGNAKGVVMFVHGGYWHKFDKSAWSYLASGCLAHGWSVAVPSYRLAPHVTIAEISEDIVAALEVVSRQVVGPIRLAGHSAGGHLVCRLLCTDSMLPEAVLERVVNVVSVSGIYDLRPLLASSMNQSLQLTPEVAIAESPALLSPVIRVPLTLWVGAEERPEFLRQTRLLCEKWSALRPGVNAVFEPDRHHFSVIDALAQPDSALTHCLLQLD